MNYYLNSLTAVSHIIGTYSYNILLIIIVTNLIQSTRILVPLFFTYNTVVLPMFRPRVDHTFSIRIKFVRTIFTYPTECVLLAYCVTSNACIN